MCELSSTYLEYEHSGSAQRHRERAALKTATATVLGTGGLRSRTTRSDRAGATAKLGRPLAFGSAPLAEERSSAKSERDSEIRIKGCQCPLR